MFKRNQKEYDRLADHIGLFPLVIISPTDSMLITEGSDIRRKLVDSIISQFNKSYLDQLLSYNKALVQRNALLKQFQQQGYFDEPSLEIWDEQLIHFGEPIHEERTRFIRDFQDYFNAYYKRLGSDQEEVRIVYQSQLQDQSLKDGLRNQRQRDRMFQYTTIGIHKDDLIFTLNDHPIKKFGSQGQQKTFLLALKLGQAEYMKESTGILPILLLDDIYDKLDANRVSKLADIVCHSDFGQVFITDAHPSRSLELFKELKADVKLFTINKDGLAHETKTGKKTAEAVN